MPLQAKLSNMKKSIQIPVYLRLMLIGIAIILITLSPRPRLLQSGLVGAYQALQDGSPGQVARRLAVVLAFEPWRTDLRLAAGRYAAQSGDYPGAVDYLEGVAEHQRLSPQDWLVLGDAYQALGEGSQAVSAWQKAQEMGADRLGVARRLLEVHQAQGDSVAISQDLKVLADLQPQNAPAHFQAGLHLAASDPETALPYLETASTLDQELASKVRRLRDAILVAVLENDPSYRLVAAGRQLAAMEEWELASQAFQNAVQINPNYGEAWAYLAEARQHLAGGQLSLARQALENALKNSPDSVLVHILASLYWQRQGDDTQAQDQLSQALRLEPENPILYVEMGNILARNGDLDTAMQAYQKAVDLDPQDISYRRALVDFLLHHQIELRQSALPVARQAVLADPENPAALDLLGETLFLLGDYHTAGRFIERALQLDPEYAPALMHLGVVSVYLGDGSKARQLLIRARDLADDQSTLNQARRLLEYYFP